MKKGVVIRIVLLVVFATALASAWALGLGHALSLESIRAQQDAMRNYQSAHPVGVVAGFFLLYVAVAALSLPGAAVMTPLGGALFGFWQGMLVVSFASSIGATLAFLLARFLLRDWIQSRYRKQLASLNEGFRNEGAFYLFALRLIPAFPFFLVNILTGVMPIKTRHFYGASQLGMLPGTAVYVYAGTELGRIKALSDIVSPSLLTAFVILGLFPLMARKAVTLLRARRNA